MSGFPILQASDLSSIPPEVRDRYFANMAPSLVADDAETRASAVEQLVMATFAAQPMAMPYELQVAA